MIADSDASEQRSGDKGRRLGGAADHVGATGTTVANLAGTCKGFGAGRDFTAGGISNGKDSRAGRAS